MLQELYITIDLNSMANTKVKAAPHIGTAIIWTRAVTFPQKSKWIFLENFLIFKDPMTAAATTKSFFKECAWVFEPNEK